MVESGLIEEIARRMISSVFISGFWLLISLGILWLFRIRNPGIRYLFIFIPMAKSLMALMRVPPQVEPFSGVLVVSAQLPFLWLNPTRAFPDFQPTYPVAYEPTAALLISALYIIAFASALFFLWRLGGFIRFQQIILRAPEIEPVDHPKVHGILGRLVAAAGVTRPRLLRIDSREAPFTVGVRRPIIALSAAMQERLSEDEMEAVLAHELAHIIRRDHLFHWPLVILRDILFFNPVTYAIYSRLSFERERACDDYGSRLSKRLHLAKSLVRMAELKKIEPSLHITRTFAPQSAIDRAAKGLALRVTHLLEPSSYGLLTASRRLTVTAAGLILFYTEIHFTVMAAGSPLVLS